jgi:hypothetical protein
VEAVRIGYVIAQDKRANARWKAMKNRQTLDGKGGGLTGLALEGAVRSLAMTNPEYVVVEAT